MTEEIDIFAVLTYLAKGSRPLAQARANRLDLEQNRKSILAKLINDCEEKTAQAKESWAYCQPEYLEFLAGLKVAIEEDEFQRSMMAAAHTKAEVFRTIQANNRFIDKVHT